MKKLCKSTLEQLAKEMPVLSEIEAQSTIAGTMFYDTSGTFLRQCGDNDTLRFVSNHYAVDELFGGTNYDHIGSSFSALDNDTKQRFITNVAESNGLSFNSYEVASSGYEMAYDHSGGVLIISPDGGGSYESMSAIVSTLAHEKEHEIHGTNEQTAIMMQIKDPSYLYTNREYRIQTANYLRSISARDSQNYIHADFLCKVDGTYK